MGDETGRELLRALQACGTAFQAVDAVSGDLGPFGNSSILGVRNDLAFTIRRLENLCLLHGVSPEAVETARKLDQDTGDDVA